MAKRLFCSTRYGRHGCGRTRQLYLAQTIPRRHHPLSTFIQFISLLCHRLTVTQAYQQAVGKPTEPRQAYRWLAALDQQLGSFRVLLEKRHRDQQTTAPFSSHRLRRLLPTLQDFLQPEPLAVQYRFQRALL
ncbi:hypothetical protein [Serratia microhaemolytica]|uniref:hypothetical protein n=1 Tax=Serratia microhaemolytica TaxID=2675110 RepID=UPI000FDF1782|nr:hypothetical protein [Serratia microhaemolytica]